MKFFFMVAMSWWISSCGHSSADQPPTVDRTAPKKKDRSAEAEEAVGPSEELAMYFDAPETIDYSVVLKHVFEKAKCTLCHQDASNPNNRQAIFHGFDLSRFDLLSLRNGIVAGNVKMSKAYQATVEEGYHREVAGFKPLREEAAHLLRLWILNCAIEDFETSGDGGLIQGTENSEKVRLCQF